MRERVEFQGLPLTPIVVAYENGETILGSASTDKGQAFIFSAFLDETNGQIQDWSYFNYLVYSLVERAAGKTPLTFGDYPGSPVPHTSDRNILLALMGALVLTAFLVFYLVRRYSKAHPEALDQIVDDQARFSKREEKTQWEVVGFHRPLSGFLVALSLSLFMFIPLIIYQNLILPVYILPSAQALGIWTRVTQFFNLAWLFFDMGTSVAFIKYLSQYRVHDPRIVIHSFIQIPGFFQVMRHALNGFQRQDYSRYLDIGLNVLMPMLVQPVFVAIMFAWGNSHPVFGATLGGLLGLGIAAYAGELFTFLIGLWLYWRLGFSARGSRSAVALTLLRCVGWLSRDDFSTRVGHAGPFSTPTPGAQMPGRWSFEYSIIPCGSDSLSAWGQAYAYQAPLRAVVSSLHEGDLPDCVAFLQVQPAEVVISAVKAGEDKNGWLVRGYNLSERPVSVTLNPAARSVSRVEQVNLAEETIGSLQPGENGVISFTARPHEIMSFRLIP